MITKYKWLLIIIAVPLLILGTFYLYWYVRSANSERKIVRTPVESTEVVHAPPDELVAGFDPSQNAGRYSVETVDIVSGQVQLRYLYPQIVRGQQISPILSCQAWDNKIFDLGKKVPRYVSGETLLSVLAETPKNQLMLSGKCRDRSCTMMDSECQLIITYPKQDETE